MKSFKIITENENYVVRGESREEVEQLIIRQYFYDVLDDDLPEAMETIEIVEI